MKKILSNIFLSFFSLLFFAFTYGDNGFRTTELNINSGYRQDFLRWSIADIDDNPNILSELTYRNIKIFQIGAEMRLLSYSNVYTQLKGDFGFVVDGQCQDSDYDGNNRTLEFSRSYSKIKNDNVYDVSLGMGYQFEFCYDQIKIIPLVGYSLHKQNFRMTDGVQVIDTLNLFGLGPIEGLNSTYRAMWNGPWIGLNFGFQTDYDFYLFANYEFHVAHYDARGFWNLRSDFVGEFRHESNLALGHFVEAGIKYPINPCSTFGIRGNYQQWKTNPGVDSADFLSTTGTILTGSTRLNPVEWHSYAILLDFDFNF